jgi:hypothetical protein
MGWTYMAICILDFAIFPILWSILQAYYDGQVVNQWDPLTLKGAGLFHMAMGAILGIAAWSRGQEKIAISSAPTPLNTPPTPLPPTSYPTARVADADYLPRNTRND